MGITLFHSNVLDHTVIWYFISHVTKYWPLDWLKLKPEALGWCQGSFIFFLHISIPLVPLFNFDRKLEGPRTLKFSDKNILICSSNSRVIKSILVMLRARISRINCAYIDCIRSWQITTQLGRRVLLLHNVGHCGVIQNQLLNAEGGLVQQEPRAKYNYNSHETSI